MREESFFVVEKVDSDCLYEDGKWVEVFDARALSAAPSPRQGIIHSHSIKRIQCKRHRCSELVNSNRPSVLKSTSLHVWYLRARRDQNKGRPRIKSYLSAFMAPTAAGSQTRVQQERQTLRRLQIQPSHHQRMDGLSAYYSSSAFVASAPLSPAHRAPTRARQRHRKCIESSWEIDQASLRLEQSSIA